MLLQALAVQVQLQELVVLVQELRVGQESAGQLQSLGVVQLVVVAEWVARARRPL